MDSGRLINCAYRNCTQTSQRNILYSPCFKEYNSMINRLNRQNQSLSISMIQLLNQNETLRKLLHQKRMEEMITKQSSSQLKSERSYLNRTFKSGIKMEPRAIKQKQIDKWPNNNTVYVSDYKKNQIKTNLNAVFKSPTNVDQLYQPKFTLKRKKGLYLSKQICKISKTAANQQNRQLITKQDKTTQKQMNPEFIQKQNRVSKQKEKQQKKMQVLFKRTSSPYKIQMKPKELNSRQSDKKQRKVQLQSMYSYLYSPIKTYNQIIHDTL